MVASPAVVNSGRLERDPLKANFKNFMWKVVQEIFGRDPTPLMYEFADRLQSGPPRDILMGFRGFAKSYITVMFGVWTLYRDPTEIVLTVSGSGPGAAGNADLAFGWISNFDWLSHMKPRGNLRQSSEAFDVQGSRMEKSESFAAMSLFGQITGRRASLIIPDDVETPNTSETEGDRARLRTRYGELGGSILKPGGRIKVLGTAQTEQTIYLELATERGYAMFMLPALVPIKSDDPKKDELRKYGPWLAPSIKKIAEEQPHLGGTPTEPTRFDEADLFARKLEYGSTEFDRQFKLFLDAGADFARALKLRDISVIDIPIPTPAAPLKVPAEMLWTANPDQKWEGIEVDSLNGDSSVYLPLNLPQMDHWQEPESKILEVDPSGGGTDETSWGVLVQHNGRVGLVALGARLEGFSNDTLRAIATDAKTWGVHRIRIEKNFGGGMFGELLRPLLQEVGHPCTIEEENAGSVQKEIRIVDSLEPLVTGHRFWIARHVLEGDWKAGEEYGAVESAKRRFYRLTYQLTRITKRKGCLAHDDRVDMLASGVTAFLGTLRRQLEAAARESKEALLVAEAEKLIEARRKQGLRLFGLEEPPQKLGHLLKDVGGLAGSSFFRGRRGTSSVGRRLGR